MSVVNLRNMQIQGLNCDQQGNRTKHECMGANTAMHAWMRCVRQLYPHSPLSHFGSEVEYLPLVMPYYHILPPANWLLSLQYLPGLLLGNGNCSYPLLFSSSYCLSYCHYCLAASPCITIIVLHSLKHRLLFLLSRQLTVPSLYSTISSHCISMGLAK